MSKVFGGMPRAVISETQYAEFYIALKTCPETRGPAGSRHCAMRLLTFIILYLGNKLQDKGSHASHADSPARELYWFTFILHVVVS